MSEIQPKKSIYQYDNFREYLRDYYRREKERRKGFSYRAFSRIAGFKSGAVLKQVIEGHRNVAPYSINKFVKALKLNNEEAKFFRNLVLLNQAATSEEKQAHAEEILRSRAYRRVHPLSPVQYNYFAKWYHVVIRELVGLTDFKEDPEWIAKRISPHITIGEARKGLQELERLGLIERNEKGRLTVSNRHITTADEVTLSSVAQYHREMMKRAAESIDRVPKDERELSAITLSVSKEMAKQIKEMIQNFRKTIVDMASQGSNPEAVYQINLHLFPLAWDHEQESSK